MIEEEAAVLVVKDMLLQNLWILLNVLLIQLQLEQAVVEDPLHHHLFAELVSMETIQFLML